MNTYFELGKAIGLAAAVPQRDKQAAANALEYFQQPGRDYGRLQKMACHVGANLYRLAGRETDMGCQVLEKLASAPAWHEIFDPYADAVLIALGQEKRALGESGSVVMGMEGVKALKGLFGGAIEAVPEAVSGVTALSALGGGSLGTLGWLLHRDIANDSVKAEQTRQRAKQYEALAARINEELKTRATSPEVVQNL